MRKKTLSKRQKSVTLTTGKYDTTLFPKRTQEQLAWLKEERAEKLRNMNLKVKPYLVGSKGLTRQNQTAFFVGLGFITAVFIFVVFLLTR